MAKYGLPYQGSKSRLAERIINLMPSASHFYDLFAGGCAITHCALVSEKWGKIHANDTTDSARFFKDVALGKYHGRNEWISREEFFQRKADDPWVRLMFSFSNDQRTYLYSREIEPYKKAVYAMLTADNEQVRRLAFRAVVRMAKELIHAGKIRIAYDMEVLERIQSLGRIEALEHVDKLNVSTGDYRDVAILPDSVIYCDIPYKGTRNYRGVEFDHSAFYDWALAQTAPLFISEYSAPSDFECIAEFERTSTFSATNNSLKKIERIFRPKTQL